MSRIPNLELQPPIGFKIWRMHRKAEQKHVPHSHADIEINYLLSGWIRYFHGGRFYDVPEDRLAVFWAGIPHQLVMQSALVEMIWITIPVNWFLGWQIPGPLQNGMLAGDLIIEDDKKSYEAQTERARILSWLADFETGKPTQHRIVRLELEARLLRLGARLPSKGREHRARPRQNLDQFVRMTDYLTRHFTHPISVGDVAKALGLHPKYSMTLFKKTCGMTMWNYLIRLRTAHAERLLLTTDQNVLELAMASGFGTLSAFYLAFQKHTGMSPARFRKVHTQS